MSTADETMASIASAQHGAFSLAQARTHGITDRQVASRVAAGRWLRVGRGVLAVAGAPTSWQQRSIVPLLARPDAVLAELSAGHLQGLVEAPLDRPALIVPPGTSARAPGSLRVHRLPLAPDDVTTVDGLRTTTTARTLVDLTAVLPPRQLVRAVDGALHRGAVAPRAIDAALGRTTHLTTAQVAVLTAALEAWRGVRPGSAAEARLLRLIASWGFEEPERQVPIRDASGLVVGRADLGWRRVRFGLEYDGDEHHGPRRWADDEVRHRRIESAGWRLDRIGARDLLPSSDLRQRLLRVLAAAA